MSIVYYNGDFVKFLKRRHLHATEFGKLLIEYLEVLKQEAGNKEVF